LIKPLTREQEKARARQTALVVAGVVALLAAWTYYRGRVVVPAVLGGASAALTLTGLLLPALAARFHVRWMQLAALLGYVNSRILLSALFYTAFALYGVVSRLAGRDPLRRRAARRESYWSPRKATRQSKEQFERSF